MHICKIEMLFVTSAQSLIKSFKATLSENYNLTFSQMFRTLNPWNNKCLKPRVSRNSS